MRNYFVIENRMVKNKLGVHKELSINVCRLKNQLTRIHYAEKRTDIALEIEQLHCSAI